jgi:ribosome-associated protein
MTRAQSLQEARILVQAAAKVCEDKKGEDTRILELDPIDSGLSDFFLLTSASNDRQSVAIADEIEHKLKKEFGVYPNSVEGRRKGEWILLDYVDFVVHVFLAERRAFYDIERLRKSARPLTPAEFDAELKADLAAKTLAARKKASAKAKPAATIVVVEAKPKMKTKQVAHPPRTAVARPAARRAAAKPANSKTTPKKLAGKKPPSKQLPVKKAAATKAAAKPANKKSSAKKVPLTKATAKKAASKKSMPKKAAVKKAPAKKAVASKSSAKKKSARKN